MEINQINRVTVLVTGASGFLGGHVVIQLLKEGYNVIGTVRSIDQGNFLKTNLNSNNFEFYVVELLNKSSFDNVFKKSPQISKIIHTAAPYNFTLPDLEHSVIRTTIEGTRNLLQSALENGPNVNHIVNTSNLAAHISLEDYSNPKITINEKSWCNYTKKEGLKSPFSASHYSKAEAERVFWKFLKDHENRFTGCSISPGFMFGPQPFDQYIEKAQLNVSSELINYSLRVGPDGLDKVPNMVGYLTDVRDVARLQVTSLKRTTLNSERLLPISGLFSLHDILDFSKEHFPSISEKLPPKLVVDIFLFTIDNSFTRSKLDFPLIESGNTIYDSVAQILKVKSI